jgi:hypothetical protein
MTMICNDMPGSNRSMTVNSDDRIEGMHSNSGSGVGLLVPGGHT